VEAKVGKVTILPSIAHKLHSSSLVLSQMAHFICLWSCPKWHTLYVLSHMAHFIPNVGQL